MSKELSTHSSRRKGRSRASGPPRQRGDGLRTCVGCRSAFPSTELIRLIAGPDGTIGVDLRRKSGGRGVHICFRRGCFDNAMRKRHLVKALRVPAIKADVDSIIQLICGQLQARVYHLLSLTQKAGQMVTGPLGISKAVTDGGIQLMVVASDVSEGSIRKLSAKPKALGIPVYQLKLTREELGRILGKGERAGGAIRKGPLAIAIEKDLNHLREIAGHRPVKAHVAPCREMGVGKKTTVEE